MGKPIWKEVRLEMSDVMALIDQERIKMNLSAEKFATSVGVTSTTYSRQKNSRQALGLDAIRAYARFAKTVGSTDILRALSAYTLEMNPDQITINPSE